MLNTNKLLISQLKILEARFYFQFQHVLYNKYLVTILANKLISVSKYFKLITNNYKNLSLSLSSFFILQPYGRMVQEAKPCQVFLVYLSPISLLISVQILSYGA